MAKQRVVNTYFWNDDYIIDLKADEKLLFLYILTNPQTDLCGAYQVALQRIVWDTKLTLNRVKAILDKFEASGKVCYRNGWIMIRNFAKHQCQTNPKVSKGIERSLNTCPDWVKEALKIGFDRLSAKSTPELLLLPEPRPTEHTQAVAVEWSYPMKELVDAFPAYLPDRITPAMIGFIESEVLVGDKSAWLDTIRDYKMNFDPATNRYLPDKTGNLLGVFRKYKAGVNQNGSGKKTSTSRKRSGDDSQSSDDYLASIGANPRR